MVMVGHYFSLVSPSHASLVSHCTQDPRVIDAMIPYMANEFGNPHSRTHQYGWDAEAAVEKARSQVTK